MVIALVILMFLIVSCSNGQPENEKTMKHAPNSEKADQDTKESPDDEKVVLPEGTLQKTDQGEAVNHLQKALNKVGYSLTVNGRFGANTTWAVTDFQLQQESLLITGIYNQHTQKALKGVLQSHSMVDPGKGLKKPDNNKSVVSNPHEVLVLVNKEHALPEGFIPLNLVVPDVQFPFEQFLPKKQMRKVASNALEKMFQEANNSGLDLYAQSGYRSYNRQDAIFASNVQQYGEKAANNVSARPGESEHQTGLTMDVTSPDVNFKLITEFGETDEGQWLKEHAAEYGFIIRYPEGEKHITQYQYEPWHLRYVGEKAATEIMQNNGTLEEFLGVVK